MLSIENISKAYGPQILFRNAMFSVGDRARIGIVGPNGAGKTTFFRMLVDEEHPDSGEIRFPKNYRVALMRQDWLPHKGDTVLNGALREFPQWFEARRRLQELEHKFTHDPSERDLADYHDAQQIFGSLGSYSVEQTAKEILTGLGFKPSAFDQQAESLSGGWRIRCHLAGLLLQNADLLLLDEPTNHLDVETIVWLEDFLMAYPNSIMVISHDRRLIQRISEDILEFAPPSLTLWPGNLKKFEELKTVRMEQLEAEIANKVREIERLQDFIDRFRAKATKARQAQSRLRTSDHYQEELVQLRAAMPIMSKRPSRFRLQVTQRVPKKAIDVVDGVFGYKKENPLFQFDRCLVEGGKKIGIIGVNGVGKSTFLRTVAGELPLLGGTIQRAEVRIGYFSQHRMEELPKGFTALEYLYDGKDGVTLHDVRTVSATLGLSGNDMEKPMDVLSGGEKSRVSLSRILLSRPGLLLLDEPTNHLDIEACQALVRGLSDYEGTVLVVSHNRDFLDSLVTHILEIVPGRASLHHGNYAEWFERTHGGPVVATQPAASTPAKTFVPKKTKEQKRQEAMERQRKYDLQKNSKTDVGSLERDLEARRKEKQELEAKLCDPEATKKPEFQSWLRRQSQVAIEIENLEEKWLALSERLEAENKQV